MTGIVTQDGLRILGCESDVEATRHRQRYAWAAHQVAGLWVLDYGCGTGYGCPILARHAQAVFGYDPDLAAIAYGKKRWWGGLHNDFERVPKRIDAIVCLEVIEHLEQHPRAMIDHLLQLAPLVVGSVPYKEPAGRNPHHKHAELDMALLSGLNGSVFCQLGNGEIVPGMDESALNMLFVVRRDP